MGSATGFLETGRRENPLRPEDGSHHLGEKLFSAGDMRTGQSLVVRALADGRDAAREADAWMKRFRDQPAPAPADH